MYKFLISPSEKVFYCEPLTSIRVIHHNLETNAGPWLLTPECIRCHQLYRSCPFSILGSCPGSHITFSHFVSFVSVFHGFSRSTGQGFCRLSLSLCLSVFSWFCALGRKITESQCRLPVGCAANMAHWPWSCAESDVCRVLPPLGYTFTAFPNVLFGRKSHSAQHTLGDRVGETLTPPPGEGSRYVRYLKCSRICLCSLCI